MTPTITIFKRTFQLAFAMSLSRLLNTINTFIGILMIGRLSTESLAASALITSTQLTLVLVGMSFLFAIGVMTARSFGAQKYEQIGAILQQGLIIATLVSIPIILIMWKIDIILKLFGQNVSLTNIDQSYFTLFLFGTPAAMWLIAMQQTLLAIQKQRFVLFMSIFGLVVSLGSAYFFIYGCGIISPMGVAGLGLAYSIQVALSCIIYAVYCYNAPSLRGYNLLRWHAGNYWDLFKKLLSIGWPISLQMGSDLGALSFVTLMIGWLGTTALAAQQISLQFFILLVVPLFAIAQSSGILIGQARGAQNILDMKRYGHMSLALGLGFGAIVTLIFILMPHQLVSLYEGSNSTPDSVLEQLAVTILILTGFRLLLDAANEIFVGSLRGLYDTKFPMIVLVSLTWIIGMPMNYIFAFKLQWGLIGITISSIIGMIVGTLILYARWQYQCKKLLQEHQQNLVNA